MNAIIMAAGTASRFFPISEETPKGLLDVRGEILIERQIRQLREAGISDITVVTGYKAEQFAYLQEKFGVSLVHNEDFNRYNNSSSLVRVADRLGDTFLCCSDHYFARNVFLDHDGESYYATRYSEGPTDEWCCETDADDRITTVTVGGSGAWYMAGHAFFNAAFSARFAPLLKAAYAADESVRQGYWEDLFIRHLAELPMKIRRYNPDDIHEFDSLAELRQFDPSWWDDTRCRLLKTICRALGCRERDFAGFERIGGMSNKNYRIRFGEKDYVLRVPGYCSGEMVDRANEEFNARVAGELGVTPMVRYFDAASGIKLADFIPEAETLHADTIRQNAHLDQIAAIYRRIHSAQTPLRNRFDLFVEMEKYDRLIAKVGGTMYTGWEEVRPRVFAIRERLEALGSVIT
ncbi:MAG: NTP transferase domain-containing protein, partial [Bacteroidota bacterium]|nr:NTP transferase domain-containing protein [Bacteroidota bacterium]